MKLLTVKPKPVISFAGALVALAAYSFGAELPPTAGITFPAIGRVVPRAAREIVSSPWSIGGETMDRDFTVYDHWKKYLGPLGAKGVRLQAGWAKCEKVKGVYNWAWLDAIIDDAKAQGVQPWVELSYGNTIYPGGGGIGLGDGFPASPEALAAWDRWAQALVRRYKDRVFEWEIWNEPDGNRKGEAAPAAYVDLHIRTATMIRAEQPKSRIWALGLANNLKYAEDVLAGLHARGRLDLVDAITIHGYPRNPDDTTNIDKLRAIIAKYGRPIEVRQGETGAPSKLQPNFALSKIPWSENSQAKWDLRRMLAHRAKDVPMNLFTISDMHYRNPDGSNLRMNYKGMVGTNPDQTVSHVKPVYSAAQTVFAIFDDTLERIADYPFTSSVVAPRKLAFAGYAQRGTRRQIAAVWFNDSPVDEDNVATAIDLTLVRGDFKQPVLIDVRTGVVYQVPAGQWKKTGGGTEFRGLPVYDAPMLIAEQATVKVAATAR